MRISEGGSYGKNLSTGKTKTMKFRSKRHDPLLGIAARPLAYTAQYHPDEEVQALAQRLINILYKEKVIDSADPEGDAKRTK